MHVLVEFALLVEGLQFVALLVGLAVGRDGMDGRLATAYLLVERQCRCAVGLLPSTLDDVVDAWHIAVELACGEQRQHVGNLNLHRRLFARGIIGLLKGVEQGHASESYTIAAIIQGLHGCQFHGLHLGHHIR